mmetsp:Transcript_14582/g.45850  ORF Transcript_14582/g.45850 Transcript_14582/m.45850 type:complete len:86 (+) Transcript_14582:82-339(+)
MGQRSRSMVHARSMVPLLLMLGLLASAVLVALTHFEDWQPVRGIAFLQRRQTVDFEVDFEAPDAIDTVKNDLLHAPGYNIQKEPA